MMILLQSHPIRPLAALLACCVMLLASLPFAEAATSTVDSRLTDARAELLRGVEHVPATGLPGSLCVFGNNAVPILIGHSGDTPAIFAAAGTLGRGRLVGLGHNGVFSSDVLKNPDMARFAVNIAKWASGNRPQPRVVLFGYSALKETLESAGMKVAEPKQAGLPQAIAQAEVAFINPDAIGANAEKMEIFVRRGGGLITAIPAWGWLQGNSGKSLDKDFGPNLVFSKAGIVWTGGTVSTANHSFDAADVPSPLLNASDALALLVRQSREKPHKLSEPEKKQLELASSQVQSATNSIPPHDQLFLPRLRQAIADVDAVPTPKKPITAEQGLARVAIAMRTRKELSIPAAQVRPDPAAVDFPGPVGDDVPRINRRVEIDTAVPAWHSTGLYAPPGQIIRVILPENAVKDGLKVQIGAHTDQLWHLDRWPRMPQLVRSFPLNQPAVLASNAFGGMIYIDVPDNCKRDTINVVIERAVEAPLFILGKTNVDDWKRTIRNRPAPWGEVGSDKFIITLPSHFLRKLDDPDALMRWWDKVLDTEADLATIPHQRKRPERMVFDVEISAGWLHAGYPVMGHMASAPASVDMKTLSTKGDWGFFHELGHNHQSPDWNFENTIEVTVNLFSLYCYDTLLPGVPPHPAFLAKDFPKRLREYHTGNKRFPDWDLFTGLLMYRQLQQGFGWDAYKKVFAEYRALPDKERPRTNDQKRDQWMVRFSRTVGRNLGPFFQWWGVPTSQAARDSIKDLPVWMPPELSALGGAASLSRQ